jgi:WD40 repeat protein
VHKLRVFISSPGDVSEERALAERVFEGISREFAASVQLELVMWEHEPLFGHAGFQQQIERPSRCDLVISILWSRLGTRLPGDFSPVPGHPAPTGTEFEILDALEAFNRLGKPNLLIYRKSVAPDINLASDAAEERLRQYRLLDEFCRHAFYDEQGTVLVAHHLYAASHEFQQKLTTHVRKWVERQVGDVEPQPRWNVGSPYRGLEAFEAEHREIYFGRSQAVSDLIQRLRRTESRARDGERVTRFLLVQGMSGLGKSSLIRAGVLPLLEGRALDGIGAWYILRIKPSLPGRDGSDSEQGIAPRSGVQAFGQTLAEAVAIAMPGLGRSREEIADYGSKMSSGPRTAAARLDMDLTHEAKRLGLEADQVRIALFIDQLEELMLLEREETESILELILDMAREGRIWVIATVRTDVLGRLQSSASFVELSRHGETYTLGAPKPDELADLIREPAQAAGLQWENRDGLSLDQAILREAAASPESLPLLEYALDQLYERRVGRQLDFAAFEALGGLQGGISRAAEAVVRASGPQAISTLSHLFRSLVRIDESGIATRRYAPMSEIQADPPQQDLVVRLVQARLCVTDERDGEPVVAFAHDALLRSLPALTDWLKDEAGLLQTRELAQRDSKLWQQHGQSDAWLASSDKLVLFKTLHSAQMTLRPDVEEFLARSQRQVHRAAQIRRGAMSLIVLLAILASIGALIATRKQREAEYQTMQASNAQLRLLTDVASERLRDSDIPFARGIILQVLRHSNLAAPGSATANVFQELRAADPAMAILAGHDNPVRRAEYSPDGAHILTASYDDTSRIWDARTGAEILAFKGHGNAVFSAHYSPDGNRVVSTSADHTARVWDAITGRQLLVLSSKQSKEPPTCAVFTPDGSRIITLSLWTLELWDASTGVSLGQFKANDVSFADMSIGAGYLPSVAISPDGRRLVTTMADHSARVWDVASQRQILKVGEYSEGIATVVFSPDGSRILTAGDRTANVWDAATGGLMMTLKGHLGYVWSAAYSADGRMIATSSVDKTARVWDASTGAMLQVFAGHLSLLCDAEFSPTGARLVTAGWDRTGRTWNLDPHAPAIVLTGHRDQVTGLDFAPDGKRIATVSLDGTLRTWNAVTGAAISTISVPNAAFGNVRYSPDGSTLLTVASYGPIRLWNATTGTLLREIKSPARVSDAAFSPDGKFIAVAFHDFTLAVWNPLTGEFSAHAHGHRDGISTITFSPDGTHILTGSADRTARIWDSRTLTPGMVLSLPDIVTQARYSAHGERIVTAVDDSTAHIWDGQTGKSEVTLEGHRSYVFGADFSPDNAFVVTASWDRTVRIWDAKNGTQLASLAGHGDKVLGVAYSPDGTHIASVSADHTARIWDARVSGTFAEQVYWEEAVETDPITAVQRTQLGLNTTTVMLTDATIGDHGETSRSDSLQASKASRCDLQAAAFYDPDRHSSGLDLRQIDPEGAIQACAPPPNSTSGPSGRDLYQLARAYLAKEDYANARRYLESSAKEGYAASQVDLATLLTVPDAKMLDPGRAVELYQHAWNQGVHIAAFLLAQLYQLGITSEEGAVRFDQNPTLAWAWYQRGAEVNEPNSTAQFAVRDEHEALTQSLEERRRSLWLAAFRIYAQAAQEAQKEGWPDIAWRQWRYRRASLARVLSDAGMMKDVADTYGSVVDATHH